MLGVTLALGVIVVGVFALRVRQAGALLGEINALRTAGQSVDRQFGQYMLAVNARLRAGTSEQPDPAANRFELPAPPDLAQLLAQTHGAQHSAISQQADMAAPIFSRIGTLLDEQHAASTSLAESVRRLRADQAALNTALLDLRGHISRAEGRARLAAARAADSSEPNAATAALRPLLIETLDLGLQANDLDGTQSIDELNNLVNNEMEPSLSRLMDLAVVADSGRSDMHPVADSVAAITAALRGDPATGRPGIVERTKASGDLAKGELAIRTEAGDLLARALGIQESVRDLIDIRTGAIRNELGQSLVGAISQSLTASGLGLLALLALARVLAANARGHVQKAVEAEEFVRSAVDSLDSHTVVLGGDARILSVNRAWRDFASANGGAGRDVLEGADYVAACDRAAAGCPEAARVAAAVRAVLAGEAEPPPVEYACHAPHEQRWFLCSIRGFARGGERFAVVSHLNITAVKQAESKLAATNAQLVEAQQHLEARVIERTAELARATEESKAASKAKSEFLATMSHEIRTPLNGVVGTLDLLSASTLSEQQKRYIQIGKTSALSLTSIINDILDFSKIEAGKLELSPTDFELASTVADVMEMLAVRASEKGLEIAYLIDPALPPVVRGDPDRLRQIVINLVNNAIKFTQRGTITLRVVPSAGNTDSNPSIRFSVTDTGIGIPKDRLDRLFKAFSQTDASFSRKYGGTGLGLAICKQLAELMGGRVGVESEPGVGSTFWFEVLLPAGHSPAPPALVAGAPPGPNLRLLVIEDHDVQRQCIAECLTSMRFRVDAAADGETALAMMLGAAAENQPFAAVLTDFVMPGMDGAEVAIAMRSRPELARTPILLLSAAQDLDPARVRRAGFAALLTKPARPSTMLDAVMTAVSPRAQALALDVHEHRHTPQAPAHPAPSDGARTRVLLAEDNEINQAIACELLSNSGFDCTVAPNGTAAVDAVRREAFDLILMDCQMPEMDGFEATREIRRLEAAGQLPVQQGRRLPIIALTANALKGDRERCIEAGMDDYASKPIDLKALLATIDSIRSTSPQRRAAA